MGSLAKITSHTHRNNKNANCIPFYWLAHASGFHNELCKSLPITTASITPYMIQTTTVCSHCSIGELFSYWYWLVFDKEFKHLHNSSNGAAWYTVVSSIFSTSKYLEWWKQVVPTTMHQKGSQSFSSPLLCAESYVQRRCHTWWNLQGIEAFKINTQYESAFQHDMVAVANW